ncbi:MAG: hypothetical protein HDT35_03485 [Clostridiales bacterium]|nr:hypothetical protein [Clostridiales bacterium]
MKKYREYMDSVRASDTLHQRLLGLETSGKRPVTWKKYGAMAAALALVLGLGAWWLGREEVYDPRLVDYAPVAPEIADEPVPDIALVEPSDVTEPGEKTIGGYEVISGSGENAMTTYYILPYIDYGRTDGAKGASASLDWDIPRGAVRRDLTWDEIITLMGGEDAVNTHLDWGEYQLTGWAAWNEDGSFWGAYINGFLPNYNGPTSQFEFAVTAGELPPTCIGYPSSVTQEIRGLTVTADGYDSVVVDASTRRVSFMKDGYGYRFDINGTVRAQTEERVSRLVCHVADRGLGLYSVDGTADVCQPEDGTYVCTYCGHVFPTGTAHNHAFIGADATYTCDLCGNTFPVGTPHTHPYDPDMCAGYPVPDPGDGVTPDMSAPPKLNVVCGDDSLTGGSGNYTWKVDLGNGLTSGTNACGLHPLDFREAPSLTTAEGRAKLSFAGSPDRVSVVCWPDSEWGNTSAASQECLVARSSLTLDYEIALNQGGWIYEVSASWDGYGTASYVFYITKN